MRVNALVHCAPSPARALQRTESCAMLAMTPNAHDAMKLSGCCVMLESISGPSRDLVSSFSGIVRCESYAADVLSHIADAA